MRCDVRPSSAIAAWHRRSERAKHSRAFGVACLDHLDVPYDDLTLCTRCDQSTHLPRVLVETDGTSGALMRDAFVRHVTHISPRGCQGSVELSRKLAAKSSFGARVQ